MQRVLERRWLHYALLSRDGEFGMVANVAWLGPSREDPSAGRLTSILLLHRRNRGWRSSQFNAITHMPPWSAFRQPYPFGEARALQLASTAGGHELDLALVRTSRPCTSQCAPFAPGQHLRWQSETGVVARGAWTFDGKTVPHVDAIGYHERVRGYWGWPELGGWVFGFANDPATSGEPGGAPATAVVFTLIQPLAPYRAATASVMLWRGGRLRRHFPRRCVSVAVHGALARDRVVQVPAMSNLFGVPPMAEIPARLVIAAKLGRDEVVLDFACLEAARIVIPSETAIRPFSVHEVIGPVDVSGRINGAPFAFRTRGIVEFAGGSGGD